MFDVYYFSFTEMMEHTFIHEPTEVSFHDLSDIGAENILNLSTIQRYNVSPVEPFVPSTAQKDLPSVMTSSVRDPYDTPIIMRTSVQIQNKVPIATSSSVYDPYNPRIIMPNNVHVQEPNVNPRRWQPTPSDPERVVSEFAPSTATPLQKLCSVCGAHVL